MEEHKALVLQKYARAWLVRRRFQTMRRLVLNVQLSYRVQQLRKKIEEQVKVLPELFHLWLFLQRTKLTPCILTEQREPWIDGKTDELGHLPLSNCRQASGSGGAAGKIHQPEGVFGGEREESERSC